MWITELRGTHKVTAWQRGSPRLQQPDKIIKIKS